MGPGITTELLRADGRKLRFVLLPALLLGLVDALGAPEGRPVWDAAGLGRLALVALVVAALMWVLCCGADAAARPRRASAGSADTSGSALSMRALPASWGLCFAISGIGVACWLLMWATVGPFDSMNDTYWMIRNPFGVARQHPVVYGMVTSGIVQGLRVLTGSLLPGIIVLGLLQIALFTLAVAWTLRSLSRSGVPRWALVVLVLVLGCLPVTANYTFALVKDSAFTAFTVLLVPVLLGIARTRGRCLQDRGFLVVTALAALGFALTRNNALAIVVVIGVLIVLLAARARRRAVLLVAGIAVVAAIPQQIVTWAAGPQKSAESLGMPLQMLGSTLVNDPQCIAPEDARTLEKIMPADAWRESFRPESVDPVKYSAAFSGDTLQDSRGEFLGAFAHTLSRCPGPMLAGYRDQTAQLWTWDTVPIGSTSQSFFLEPISNYPADREEILGDLARQDVVKHPLLGEAAGARMEALYRGVLDLTPGTGTWVWALVLVVLAAWYRRRGEVVVICAPALLLWGTLMAAAPTAMPFRYAAYLPWILAIAVCLLLGAREAEVSRPDARRAAGRSRRRSRGTGRADGPAPPRAAPDPR